MLTAEEVEAYERDGFLIRRGVIDTDTLASIKAVFEDAVDRLADSWVEAGVLSDPAKDASFDQRWNILRSQLPAMFATAWRRILVSPAVYELWQHPALLETAHALVGQDLIAHSVWNGRPRDSHGLDTQRIHWHQDAHYYKQWDQADGRLMSAWLPLVPVDASVGCLEFGTASHKQGLVPQIPSVNGLRTVPDEYIPAQPLVAEMEPGDVVFFSDLTLHRALDNTGDRVRWSIDIRYGEATEPVVRKSGRGYLIGKDSFEDWHAKYQYTLTELGEELGADYGSGNAEEIAKAIGTSALDLESY